MNLMKKEITLTSSALMGNKACLLVMALTIALFVLSAGAPAAGIGIGK